MPKLYPSSIPALLSCVLRYEFSPKFLHNRSSPPEKRSRPEGWSVRNDESSLSAPPAPPVSLPFCFSLSGCHRHRKSKSAPNTDAYSDNLHQLVEKKALPPEKVDTTKVPEPALARFLRLRVHRSRPSTTTATTKSPGPATARRLPTATGLHPAVSRCRGERASSPRTTTLPAGPSACRRSTSKSADAISLFDVAMTVNVMRYISDLRIGRVNPQHFNFDINVADKKYDLAEFVSDNVVDATDVPEADRQRRARLRRLPQNRAGARPLPRPRQTAGADNAAEPLPTVTKPVIGRPSLSRGSMLSSLGLQLEGDAPVRRALVTAGIFNSPTSRRRQELSASPRLHRRRQADAADDQVPQRPHDRPRRAAAGLARALALAARPVPPCAPDGEPARSSCCAATTPTTSSTSPCASSSARSWASTKLRSSRT